LRSSSATEQRVHPLQAFDAGDVAALQDAVDQQRGLVVAQRTAQHGLHVVAGVGDQEALRACRVGELHQHLVDLVARDGAGLGDGFAQALHLFGRECLNTSAASSSPSDIRKMAASCRPSSFMAASRLNGVVVWVERSQVERLNCHLHR
jgi:NAD(P)-dependent dehydrogenase (short-subunit alcohol dehydrogenase family)